MNQFFSTEQASDEIRCFGIAPRQANQNVKKLTELWKVIDPTMSLDPNVLSDGNNIDDRYVPCFLI